jgi:membrane-bound lytic murein transglycosylase F
VKDQKVLGLKRNRHYLLAATATLVFCCLPLIQPKLSSLQKARESGSITIATINGPSTYFEDRFGHSGFEYELAQLFADSLGLSLEVLALEDIESVYRHVEQNKVDFAASGLRPRAHQSTRFVYSSGYQDVSQKLIYKRGKGRPDSFADIHDDEIMTLSSLPGRSFLQSISGLPKFTWLERDDLDALDMLRLVDEEVAKYTIVDSTDWSTFKHVFPHLSTAFDIGSSDKVSWVFANNSDESLYLLAEDFLKHARQDGTLDILSAKHFDHLDSLNYAGAKIFLYHVKHRLPQYEQTFKVAAQRFNLDWRLLAAMSYQESQWNAKAISPTGVQGLMMLTKITANELGVEDRLDPVQSIFGGAEYFRKLLNRFPEGIPEEDRNWQALAAYNAGWGHLLDARRFARWDGENPNDWYVVKKYLPKLQHKRWYSKSTYGYAPGGRQSLEYVKNIKLYYAALVFTTREQGMTKVSQDYDALPVFTEENQSKAF